MPQSNTDKNNGDDDHPSASELIGIGKRQLKRQGDVRKKRDHRAKDSSEETSSYQESGGWFYQSFLGTASIAFVVLGLIALSIWGIQKINSPAEPELTPASAPDIISIIASEKITFSTTTPISLLADSLPRNEGFGQSYAVRISDNQEVRIGARDFLNLLGSELGLRAHLNDEFMYGGYKEDQATGRFLIFSVGDYRGAYGALLSEEDRLGETFSELRFSKADQFTDRIIANQDVRMATGAEGALFYSFPRQSRLVITTDEQTLRAILERLNR